MIAMQAAAEPRLDDSAIAALFNALSVRFGGGSEALPALPALPEDEIQRLVGLARRGDRAARQRLYREHVDAVYRTVRGMLRSAADAEDVTQDAMLTVLTSLDRYAPRDGVRFAAWVTAVALNTARRRFRRRRPELAETSVLAAAADEAVDLEQDAETAQRRRMLLDALAKLEHGDRDVLCLRYGAELDAPEIAALVGREPAAVRKMLERARERLRAHLVAAHMRRSDGQ